MQRASIWRRAVMGACVVTAGVVGMVAVTAAGQDVAVQSAVQPVGGRAPGPGIDAGTVAELTVDGNPPLACEGLAPIDVLAASPGAENADTPEAAGLRDLIAHDVTGGMSPQTPHDWVLVARNGDRVHFGQRVGPVGISALVELKREGDRYGFAGSGGCGPVGYADGHHADLLRTYIDRGDHLDLSYDGDTCDLRTPWIRVHETATTVDVLVLQPRATHEYDGNCFGGAREATVTAPLRAPLGGRSVRNIAYLPATVLQSKAEYEAEQAARDAAYYTADRACRAAAADLHRPVVDTFPIDVASVRAAVPATRESWRDLPGDAVAGDCNLDNGDRSTMAVVAAKGVPYVVRIAHHTGNTYDPVPELGKGGTS